VGYSAGINWYLYCGNNPVVLVDPLGLIQRLGIHTISKGWAQHSWITIQNTDTGRGSSYALYHDYLIQEYGATRLWPSTDVVINYDPVRTTPLDSAYGASRYVDLTREQYKEALNFIYEKHEFRTATNNCSSFASDTWRAATGEDLNADTWYFGGAETPWKLRQSIEKTNMSNNLSTNNSLTGTYNSKK
jgi:hypothetical protein